MVNTNKIIKLYRYPILNKIAHRFIRMLGADISTKTKIGDNVRFMHNGLGVVIGDDVIVEDNVKILQNVTIGRADIYKSTENYSNDYKGVIIRNGACICVGACVLGEHGILTVGENSVVAANAVLTKSIGPREIWGGVPAKFIKVRDDI